MSTKNVFRAVCAAGGVLLLAGSVAPGAAAVASAEDSGDVSVTVRKTVRQTGTPSGEITESSMYTQVSAVGSGTRTVTVPVGVDSNRNLNDFGAFPMEGQSIVFDLDVDGNVEERTLTDAESYPMTIAVRVTLDGQEIAPEDVVGETGVLDVEYTVTNTTQTTEQITFTDAEGNEVTEDFETATPFAGSLDIVLPQGFNEVTAPGATIAGNGENGTQLGYTMVLFPPLGSVEAKVAYQARVANASFPEASFSFLPLVPFENGTIAGAVESYRGGAETGSTIAGAGIQIGDNLLKLQDGAGQLLAGLGQLSAGADQLSDGLQNTAAPGSAALADGANQVSDGLDELNSNVPALEEGVEQLDDGAQQLNEGMETLNAGLAALSDPANGMPALEAGAKQLAFGISHPVGATGASDPGGLLEGLKALTGGLTQASTGADKLAAGLPTAKGGVDQVKGGLDAALAPGGAVDQLQGGVESMQLTTGCQSDPVCVGTGDKVILGVKSLRSSLTGASGGLGAVSAGLADAVKGSADLSAALSKLLLPGAQKLTAGVETSLKPGMDKLVAGLTKATAGVLALYEGSQKLTAGTEQLADGTQELNSRVPTLASGVEQLDDGAAQVADGADQLATGLGDAADGSGQLADGLDQAEPGAGQIEEGAGRLKTEGSDELVKAGKDAQIGFARNVAQLESAQQTGLEGAGIPFGPAQGSDVVTSAAYAVYLDGVAADTESNTIAYVLGGVFVAGAAGAAFAARRRLTA